MYRFKKSLVTLAAGAALVTGVAAAPAQANDQDGLVNVNVENLLNHNQITLLQNVSVPVAATVCGIQANVLSAALAQGQAVKCTALSTAIQKAWVSYN